MKDFSLYKVYPHFATNESFKDSSKTDITKKPKISSSRKNAYFQKCSKICLANKKFYDLGALVQNE